jgi:hypothetical protein
MANVVTLDGTQNVKLWGKHSKCTPVKVYSKVLDEYVTVCGEELDETPRKRGRGRPPGTTVKRGAKRPKVSSCKDTKVVKTRSGRKVCKCADPANAQILPNSRCGIERRKKS